MTKAANRQRGEVKIVGPEGEEFKLCLTLGAIAQIEEELGVESLTEIDTVMGKARMKDVITIFLALLHGGELLLANRPQGGLAASILLPRKTAK